MSCSFPPTCRRRTSAAWRSTRSTCCGPSGHAGHRVHGAAVEHVTSGVDACTAVTDDADGYPTHRLTLSLPPSRPFPLLAGHPAAEAWFARLLGETTPDVVHVQSGYLLGAPAMAAARRAGIPVVLTLHDYWFACPRVTLRHPAGEICSGPERPVQVRLVPHVRPAALPAARSPQRWRHDAWPGSLATVARWRSAGRSTRWCIASTSWPTCCAAPRWSWRRRASSPRRWPPAPAIRSRRFASAATACRRSSASGRAPGATLRLAFIGQLAPHKGVHLAVAAVRALPDRPITLDVYGPLTPYPEYVAHAARHWRLATRASPSAARTGARRCPRCSRPPTPWSCRRSGTRSRRSSSRKRRRPACR